MKPRLIDANALMEYTQNHISKTIDCNDIARFPTAYSVDAVVKQLEEIKMRHFLTMVNTGDDNLDFAYEYVGNALDTAIEIVKKGGAV